jgi:hypothetical protein
MIIKKIKRWWRDYKVTRKKDKDKNFAYYLRIYTFMVFCIQIVLYSLNKAQILPLNGCLLYSPLWFPPLFFLLVIFILNTMIKVSLWRMTQTKRQIDEGLKNE